jgi:hypothetical protein
MSPADECRNKRCYPGPQAPPDNVFLVARAAVDECTKRARASYLQCVNLSHPGTCVPQTTANLPAVESARGVILTAKEAEACEPFTSKERAGFAMPSLRDVQRIERALPSALAEIAAKVDRYSHVQTGAAEILGHLATDTLFYVGSSDGHIDVYGYCQDPRGGFVASNDANSESRCPPIVFDGGSCFWRIRFDVKRGTFDRFEFNGVA